MSFLSIFKRQKWRLCKIIEAPTGLSWGNMDGPDADRKQGRILYTLFESDKGKRRCKISSTIRECPVDKAEEYAMSTKFYQTKIYRWLAGRSDPEIPRFNEIDQEETMHQLRGTIKDDF